MDATVTQRDVPVATQRGRWEDGIGSGWGKGTVAVTGLGAHFPAACEGP